MQTVSTIGLDIAKSLFQVHGIDACSLPRPVARICTRSGYGHNRDVILCVPSSSSCERIE
jgi:hypothetical protein